MKPRKIFIIDGYPILREAFASFIGAESDLEVCGQADSAAKALSLMKTLRPDIVVSDIGLPGRDGLDLVKDLGTIYQQDLPEIARVLAESDATTEEDMADFLDVAQYATMMAPSYTIQGGTTQVLRGIVARGLGLR